MMTPSTFTQLTETSADWVGNNDSGDWEASKTEGGLLLQLGSEAGGRDVTIYARIFKVGQTAGHSDAVGRWIKGDRPLWKGSHVCDGGEEGDGEYDEYQEMFELLNDHCFEEVFVKLGGRTAMQRLQNR